MRQTESLRGYKETNGERELGEMEKEKGKENQWRKTVGIKKEMARER